MELRTVHLSQGREWQGRILLDFLIKVAVFSWYDFSNRLTVSYEIN